MRTYTFPTAVPYLYWYCVDLLAFVTSVPIIPLCQDFIVKLLRQFVFLYQILYQI